MSEPAKIKKIFFVIYLVLLHGLAAFLVYEKIYDYRHPAQTEKNGGDVAAVVPLPSPVSLPYEANNNVPPPAPETNLALPESKITVPPETSQSATPKVQVPENSAGKLMIPVIGIKSEDLQDTYTQARSGGRVHNAIDIMAPGGAPVVATADGEIVKFFDSKLGGITIYQISADKKYFYYYAHLQRRADNLREKTFVKQGTIIGYVGDTGNAGAGNYHLHFTITVVRDPNRFWDGDDINPYPILKEGIPAQTE